MASSCCQRSSGNSFLFGLFLGAIIGASIAIVLYRHQRGRVISLLKKKFQQFLSSPIPSSPKKKVVLPVKITRAAHRPPSRPSPSPRLFSKKK